jgi:hypothetical protein
MHKIGNDSALKKKGATKSSTLLIEGIRVFQKLRFIIQNCRPGADEAVSATLALAKRATLDFAFAAHAPETARFAQQAAHIQDNIPVLKGRVPPVANCLNDLKTFHSYRPRPRLKSVSDRERYAIAMLDSDISEFWRSIVLPRSNMPPIAMPLRTSLLGPDNRQNATVWARALLNWREERGLGFMLNEDGPLREICARINRPGKRSTSNSVRAGFIKLAREHFAPLLKHEANQTNFAHS